MRYKIRYIDRVYKPIKNIALDIGNICHKVLELKFSPEEKPSFSNLMAVLNEGFEGDNEHLLGLKDISAEYFEDYYLTNPKSNKTYRDKIDIFIKKIQKENIEEDWSVVAVEFPFSFKYSNFVITGKIDRIDVNSQGEYRVVDYKTANVPYSDKDLKTPMQMFIYAMAVKEKFGSYPIRFEYDFVLLDEKREAMSRGWERRGANQLQKLTEERNNYYNTGKFPPCPSPLCYYCDYRGEECPYYSLWTPQNKVYNQVNMEYNTVEGKKSEEDFVW